RKGTMCVWDVANERAQRWQQEGSYISRLSFSPDGHLLGVGRLWEEGIQLCEVRTRRKIADFTTVGGSPSCVTFVDARRLAYGPSRERSLRVLDVATGRTVSTFDHPYGGVASVLLLRDRKHFITTTTDSTLVLWDTGVISAAKRLG